MAQEPRVQKPKGQDEPALPLLWIYIYTRTNIYMTWIVESINLRRIHTRGIPLHQLLIIFVFFLFSSFLFLTFHFYSGYLHLALVWFFFRRLPVGYTKWCWDIMALAWRKLSKASLPSFITLFSFYIFFPLYIFFKAVSSILD